MTADYLLFILLGFTATLISAVFGLGTALVTLSLGAWILPVKEVIALSAVLFVASTLAKSLLYRQIIPWRAAIGISVISLPFAWLGGLCVDAVQADLLRRLLGLMVLASLAMSRFSCGGAKPGPVTLAFGAGIYGFISGLLGSGNLIKALLFRPMALGQTGFVGMMAATSVLTNVGKLGAYVQVGLLTREQWMIMGGLIAAAVLAVIVGGAVLVRLEARRFELGLQVILVISALLLLL